MTTLTIKDCTEPDQLYCHYPNEYQPQPAHLWLNLRSGEMGADWDTLSEGNNTLEVYYGFERRYRIPVQTAEAANGLMRDLAPLAQRILNDWTEEYDHNHNLRAVLGKDAAAAEDALTATAAADIADEDRVWGYDPYDLCAEVDLEAEGLNSSSTDEDIDRIARTLVESLNGPGSMGVTVCAGLEDYLRELRQELRDDT